MAQHPASLWWGLQIRVPFCPSVIHPMPLALSNFFSSLKKNKIKLQIDFSVCTSISHFFPASCPDTCFAKLGISAWSPPLVEAFWQQEAAAVGLTQRFGICPPAWLPYLICSSCTCSLGRGSQHSKTDIWKESRPTPVQNLMISADIA